MNKIKYQIIIVSLLLAFFVLPALGVATKSEPQSDKPSQNMAASDDEDGQRPELERIDQAGGNKVGEKIEQRTCLDIIHRFADAGIDFAFPTRTLHLANRDGQGLQDPWLEKGQGAI